jgi:hypothetical protein
MMNWEHGVEGTVRDLSYGNIPVFALINWKNKHVVLIQLDYGPSSESGKIPNTKQLC